MSQYPLHKISIAICNGLMIGHSVTSGEVETLMETGLENKNMQIVMMRMKEVYKERMKKQ